MSIERRATTRRRRRSRRGRSAACAARARDDAAVHRVRWPAAPPRPALAASVPTARRGDRRRRVLRSAPIAATSVGRAHVGRRTAASRRRPLPAPDGRLVAAVARSAALLGAVITASCTPAAPEARARRSAEVPLVGALRPGPDVTSSSPGSRRPVQPAEAAGDVERLAAGLHYADRITLNMLSVWFNCVDDKDGRVAEACGARPTVVLARTPSRPRRAAARHASPGRWRMIHFEACKRPVSHRESRTTRRLAHAWFQSAIRALVGDSRLSCGRASAACRA